MSSRRKRRVLVLCHEDLVPPDDAASLKESERENFRTEFEVIEASRRLGHEVRVLGLHDELAPLRDTIKEFKPHVVVNLLEEFHGEALYDQNVVGYLELLRAPYTGCNPRGLVIGRDKALSKKILSYHRIRVPRFAVFPRKRAIRRPARLEFPLIVKSLTEDASMGIAEASVVRSEDKFIERVEFIHRTLETAAIVEEFVEGREIYVGVLGHRRLTLLPPWELRFEKLRADAPRIATRKVKWDTRYAADRGLRLGPAEGLDDATRQKIDRTTRRIYKRLGLSGYARVDFRLREDGELFFLEANPNPDLAANAEMAEAAEAIGLGYEGLIAKILALGERSLER